MEPTQSTERELYAESDAWNADRIFVEADGRIGIDVGGMVIVAPLKDWHHWALFGRRVYAKESSHTQEESLRSPRDVTPLGGVVVGGIELIATSQTYPNNPSANIPAALPIQSAHQVPTD